MVSDSTLISMPWKGWAASTNHCISFIWSSRDRVDGWNSLSTHFSAAAISAHDAPGAMRANAATVPNNILLIAILPLPFSQTPAHGRHPPAASGPSEHRDGVDEREAESPPQARTDQPEPCQIDR